MLYEILENRAWERNPTDPRAKSAGNGLLRVIALSLIRTYTVTLWKQIHISPGALNHPLAYNV